MKMNVITKSTNLHVYNCFSPGKWAVMNLFEIAKEYSEAITQRMTDNVMAKRKDKKKTDGKKYYIENKRFRHEHH